MVYKLRVTESNGSDYTLTFKTEEELIKHVHDFNMMESNQYLYLDVTNPSGSTLYLKKPKVTHDPTVRPPRQQQNSNKTSRSFGNESFKLPDMKEPSFDNFGGWK